MLQVVNQRVRKNPLFCHFDFGSHLGHMSHKTAFLPYFSSLFLIVSFRVFRGAKS